MARGGKTVFPVKTEAPRPRRKLRLCPKFTATKRENTNAGKCKRGTSRTIEGADPRNRSPSA
jgi:hypothetical protein